MQIRIQDKRGGRFIVDDVVLNHYGKAMGMSGITLYVTLCRYADNRTQECYPSVRLIQQRTGMTMATIIDAFKRLEKLQLLVAKKTPGRVTVYTLLEPLEEGVGKDEILRKYYAWIKKRVSEKGASKSITPPHITSPKEGASKSIALQNQQRGASKSDTSASKSIHELNSIELTKLKELISPLPPALKTSLKEFIEHRKQIKEPMTTMALEKLVVKLSKHEESEAVAMVDQSIENGWKGVFDLKQRDSKKGVFRV